jgi:hypothetical protein
VPSATLLAKGTSTFEKDFVESFREELSAGRVVVFLHIHESCDLLLAAPTSVLPVRAKTVSVSFLGNAIITDSDEHGEHRQT